MGIELRTSRMFTSRSTFQKVWDLFRLQTNSGAGAKQKTKWSEPNGNLPSFPPSQTGFIPAWTCPGAKSAQQHFRSSSAEIWNPSSKQAVCTKSWDSYPEIGMGGGEGISQVAQLSGEFLHRLQLTVWKIDENTPWKVFEEANLIFLFTLIKTQRVTLLPHPDKEWILGLGLGNEVKSSEPMSNQERVRVTCVLSEQMWSDATSLPANTNWCGTMHHCSAAFYGYYRFRGVGGGVSDRWGC